MLSSRFTRAIDFYMLFLIIAMAIISCLFIFTASQSGQYEGNFVTKQILFYILGFVFMFVIALLDSEQLKKISWLIYGLTFASILFLIIAPYSIARPINGAKAWYQLPFIGSFQPSEFMKISFIIVVSNIIDTHNKNYNLHTTKLDLLLIAKIAIVTLPPAVVVLRQPDTGIVGVLSFQIFQNIGMTIGLLPVTGVTLPFLSYGGSSLLSNMMLLGLAQGVMSNYKGYMFSQETDY